MNKIDSPGYEFKRRYDIDWLRNFCILLLFPFHAARIFDYWEPNYIQNDELSWILSWFIAVSAYWFMPLLFLLAGSASWFALQSRTGAAFLRERFTRLFIPLIFGVLILVPPQGYFAKLSQAGYREGYWEFLKTYFFDFSDLTGYFGTFTPAHLWFILYLFVISVVALPLFLYLKRTGDSRKIGHKMIELLRYRTVLLSLFIPLTILEALPAPGGKNPFYYLFIFIIGYMICMDYRNQKTINGFGFKTLLFLLCYIPVWFILALSFQEADDWAIVSIILSFIRNFAVMLTLYVILSYGNKLLNTKHRWLPYLNEAAFPIYILHQSVMMVIGYYIVQLPIGVLPKFLAICILTLLACFFLFEYVVRRTAVTRWIFGVKTNNRQLDPDKKEKHTLNMG